MKSENGVTLISLTVYIIGLTLIIAIVAVISTFFYKSVRNVSQTVDPITEYSKFNTFFTEETNTNNIKILECGENYIVFDNGVQYTFIKENKGIYRNKVKICRGIEECKFTNKIENGKNIIEVSFGSGKVNKETEYTLDN